MKFSLALGERRPLDVQTARGCFTANLLGVPGLGSLAAGRRSGYPQMALSLSGLAMTAVQAAKLLTWFASRWKDLQSMRVEPDVYLHELWLHFRWPLLGMAIFLTGWLWALATSLSILAEAKAAGQKRLPPKI